MKINYAEATLELTQKEATQAGKLGSPMCKQVNEIRKEFPSFKIIVDTTKKKASKNSKINYAAMERYISFHDDEDGTKMREFNALRNAKENGALTSKSFFEIKKWFFEAFPDAA